MAVPIAFKWWRGMECLMWVHIWHIIPTFFLLQSRKMSYQYIIIVIYNQVKLWDISHWCINKSPGISLFHFKKLYNMSPSFFRIQWHVQQLNTFIMIQLGKPPLSTSQKSIHYAFLQDHFFHHFKIQLHLATAITSSNAETSLIFYIIKCKTYLVSWFKSNLASVW